MHDVFNTARWPSLWQNAMRHSKQLRDEEPFKKQKWFKKLADKGSITSAKDNFAYAVNTDENRVTAFDLDGNAIGGLSLGTGSDGNTWLDQIEVDENLRRQGIGTELVRLAVIHFDFLIPGVQHSDDYAFSLTGNGENLINACLEKNFVLDDQLRYPPDVPLEEDTELDPGLIIGSGRIADIYTERTRDEARALKRGRAGI